LVIKIIVGLCLAFVVLVMVSLCKISSKCAEWEREFERGHNGIHTVPPSNSPAPKGPGRQR
jgi:hypothetical protein